MTQGSIIRLIISLGFLTMLLTGCSVGPTKAKSGLDVGYNNNHRIYGEKYYARIAKNSDGDWRIDNISGAPLPRNSLNEEILLISADLKRVHLAFNPIHVSRAGYTFVCDAREIFDKGLMSDYHKKKPYNGCNSNFMEASTGSVSGIWGKPLIIEVDVDELDNVIRKLDLLSAVRKEKSMLSAEYASYEKQKDRKKAEKLAEKRMKEEQRKKEYQRLVAQRRADIEASGVGSKICKTDNQVNYFGYVEKFTKGRIQVRVSDARLVNAPTVIPGGFMSSVIWDIPGNWYLCSFEKRY